jgi:peptidyl-prolyl cis-trans isomerase SurA
LESLRQRIIDGDDFATLARSNSDDKGSAINGGDLNWVGPGALVPPFEAAMNKLAINEISEHVQTQFGWHIIQVLEREDRDNSTEHKKSRIKEEIRKRKIEEETELWLRRLRDEAFVDINLDRL